MVAILDTRLHDTFKSSNNMEIEAKLLEYLQGKISFNDWLEGAASRERHTLMPGPSGSLGIGNDQAGAGLASEVSRPSPLLRPMSMRNDSDARNIAHRMMQDVHVQEDQRNFDGNSDSDIVRDRIEEMVADDDDADFIEEAENGVSLADIEERSQEESNEEEMMTGEGEVAFSAPSAGTQK